MMIKLLIGKHVVAIVQTYTPEKGLTKDLKDTFYEDLISHVSKFGKSEQVILGFDLKIYAEKDANVYDGIYGGFVYGFRNLEGERILEMGSALDMIVSNTFSKICDTRLITYTLRPLKTLIAYIMVRNKDRKK